MTKSPATHPAWATKHKKTGTELRCIKGKYYLYEYKTVYDSSKKRAKKISGKIPGSITEQNGFIPSAKRMVESGVDYSTGVSKKILVMNLMKKVAHNKSTFMIFSGKFA